MKRLLLFTSSLLILFIASCSDNSTSSDPDPEPEETGTLEITTSTSGSDQDSDGYTFSVDNSDQSISKNETIIVEELSEGSYDAALTGIAENCSVDGENPRSVNITAEETTSITFEIICTDESNGGSSTILKNKIVFSSDRPENDHMNDIYAMNTDSSGKKKITDTNSDFDNSPAISNDGSKVVFSSLRNSASGDLFVINADGSGLKQLTSTSGLADFPSWSPDDSRIVFEDNRSGNSAIYIINADGSNEKLLTTENLDDDEDPSWSPSGKRIAFASERDGDYEIFTMKTDGSDIIKVTDNTSKDHNPAWSPDGSRIAFAREGNIYTMKSDGSDVVQITDSNTVQESPSWSPDGTKIVYSYEDSYDEHDIHRKNADGSGSVTKLTDDGSSNDFFPSWSPVK